ncbi:hypothetical protein YC2023_014455 [Brassica napus]
MEGTLKIAMNAQDSNENAQERLLELPRIDCIGSKNEHMFLLTIMIGTMKEMLVQKEDDDLWDITLIQIQWIALSLKDELFPEEEF